MPANPSSLSMPHAFLAALAAVITAGAVLAPAPSPDIQPVRHRVTAAGMKQADDQDDDTEDDAPEEPQLEQIPMVPLEQPVSLAA